MLWIMGYPGTGTRWAARVLNAGHETFVQEPFLRAKKTGLMAGFHPELMEEAERMIATCVRGLPPGTRMVKEEFGVPYHMRLLEPPDNRLVYIRRKTLGNVAFLADWQPIMGWTWYFEGLVQEGGEWARQLWPESAPADNIPCTLAVAHEVQLKADLAAAQESGVAVFDYDLLCANPVDEFGGMCDILGMDFTPAIRDYALQSRVAPENPVLDEQTTAWVEEIARRAQA
jgi:hypothetical protein